MHCIDPILFVSCSHYINAFLQRIHFLDIFIDYITYIFLYIYKHLKKKESRIEIFFIILFFAIIHINVFSI